MHSRQTITGLALLVGTLVCGTASAIDIPVGSFTTIRMDNLFTAGAAVRTTDPDASLISKSTLNPGICIDRVSPGAFNSPDRAYMGDTCNASVAEPPGSQFRDANERYVSLPGSFGPNAERGNTNFEKGDFVNVAAKLTTDFSWSIPVRGVDFNFFVRTLMLFDERYINLRDRFLDETLAPPDVRASSSLKSAIGARSQLFDAFVSANLPFIGDRTLSVKLGRQVLNWGESAFLVSNSLNFINPPSQALLRVPGFDIAELLQPQNMLVLDADIVRNLSIEAFYQLEWRPVEADPIGSFFSSSDIAGSGGGGFPDALAVDDADFTRGPYAMLAFGKVPEDPLGVYEPWRNPEDPAAITGSTSSRTVYRDLDWERRNMPSDTGQYGAAVKWFLPRINNGLEIGLYYANYHSRFPLISARAADDTCVGRGAIPGSDLIDAIGGLLGPIGGVVNIAQLVADCEVPLGNLGAALGAGEFAPAGRESLPLDSARLMVEYPEDISLYGISFNTGLGNWAFSGEYAFRDRLPTQIHSVDLIMAALQPAFPEEDVDLTIATLPGRRTAVPSFLPVYRNHDIQAGDYIRGYEYLKTGQVNLNFIRFLGGAENPFGASQMTLILEVGFNHVIDFPGLDELQFNGGQADTHISNGADGTSGIQPADRAGEGAEADTRPLRQNPTAWDDHRAFGSRTSWGYRAVALTQYNNFIFNSNLTITTAMFHDVRGTTPGIGGNFVDGRRQMILGAALEYLNSLQFSVRYTWFTGGGQRDILRDRDNVQFFVGYRF